MKFLIALLLACIFGTQIANTINAAARDVSQSQKAACKSRVML